MIYAGDKGAMAGKVARKILQPKRDTGTCSTQVTVLNLPSLLFDRSSL
jgi:hypothetical protein